MSGALGTVRELEAHEWLSFQTGTGQQVTFTTQRFQQRPLHLEQPRRGFREAGKASHSGYRRDTFTDLKTTFFQTLLQKAYTGAHADSSSL